MWRGRHRLKHTHRVKTRFEGGTVCGEGDIDLNTHRVKTRFEGGTVCGEGDIESRYAWAIND